MSLATPRTFTRRSALVATAMLASGVRAQPSSKPLRIVVAFAPGSGNDITARDLARYMGELLKQPVIVENKPGAGGSIGTEYVARAAPDGLTIGFGTSSQMVMNVGLYRSLPFDVDRDLRSVGLVSRTNMLLAGKAAGPKPCKCWACKPVRPRAPWRARARPCATRPCASSPACSRGTAAVSAAVLGRAGVRATDGRRCRCAVSW